MTKRGLLLIALAAVLPLPALAAIPSCVDLSQRLSTGSRGSSVILLQQFLAAQGLLQADEVTGNFLGKTTAAVKQWQSGNGIEAIGIVGPQTLLKLACESSISKTNGSQNTATATPAALSTVYLQKKALIFSLDQNFGNGIIQQQDLTGLQRMIGTLKSFQGMYEVYALVPSDQKDKSKLDWALTVLKNNSIPFVLDVYSSDALTLGLDSVNAPYDISHGRHASIYELRQYKRAYGSAFAGVRVFEVFGQNATVLGCRKYAADWCEAYKQFLPTDNFSQKAFLEDYLKFVHENGMFLLLSDQLWMNTLSDYSNPNQAYMDELASIQTQNEQDLKALLAVYPGTVVVAYDNNAYNEASRARANTWTTIVQPYVQYGAKGFGLSDQSWMCNDETKCLASELASWASSAFASGALIVETEPYWYWWVFPKGIIGPQTDSYVSDPQWVNRGSATQNLPVLASALGVSISSAGPTLH